MNAGEAIPCVGCDGLFRRIEGPTHRYMESSSGCWAAYGEVLARESGDAAYSSAQRLGVDAYAVLHPGRLSPPSIQSIAGHLVRLCLLLEKGVSVSRANDVMLQAAQNKSHYFWLTPPPSRGHITVADVHRTASASAHVGLVAEWAAWSAHHSTVRQWLPPGH